ncbi:uncharacterized protein LOC107369691 [Tetranychus urticae]|uniref:Uncharacterized protein n=1 Tax=Tetranychus urticae TaxID=32264 RepID=T1L2G7_TETUR|nr:uncharacterized protein LOC107369691 [Tetranychus urticae]
MIRQSLTLILVLSVISSIHSQLSPADVLNQVCETSMKTIKAGTYEKRIKDRQECREKTVPKDVLAAAAKCEEAMPMLTADQVNKVCNAKDANLAKFTEVLGCFDKVLGEQYTAKFSNCCNLMDPDNDSKRSN